MSNSVLITDDCHEYLRDGLAGMGYRCDFEPDITDPQTRERIPDYAGLIVNSKIRVDRDFLDRASRLKFIGRLGSGMEMIDRDYAAQRGVRVIGSPAGNANAVAEQALGMLLALAANLARAGREMRQLIWRREANRGWELMGKTIGIIGFGHTGRRFGGKLAGLGVRILAYDKYKTDYASGMSWVQEADLEQIQREADVISLHLPLTPETAGLVDARFLASCKPGVALINTSRGACVRTADLLDALRCGQVSGACLDVFENEKPHTYTPQEEAMYRELLNLDQVVATPHIAGWTRESKYRMAEILLDGIRRITTAEGLI
ncbi:MAG: NAD(P)-dependent oxidoreductase [Saprospiraceae bacterium]